MNMVKIRYGVMELVLHGHRRNYPEVLAAHNVSECADATTLVDYAELWTVMVGL